MRIFQWIKTHKLSSVFLAIILFYFFGKFISNFFFATSLSNLSMPTIGGGTNAGGTFGKLQTLQGGVPYGTPQGSNIGFAPRAAISNNQADQNSQDNSSSNNQSNQNRLVTHESYLSLLVSDVRNVSDKIISYANSIGGYMVSSNFSNPGEAPSAVVVVRVPSNNLNSTLTYFRGQSFRVISENLSGDDVTDQYKDIQAQLATLNITKSKFEALLDKTNDVSQILDIQQRIIDVQNQIDQLKGQQQYLQQSAAMSKVTVYLSTDELALPYAPDTGWRPTVIFKEAIRSLIHTLDNFAFVLIWIGVYAVIWLPILVTFIYFKRYWRKKVKS